VRIPASLVVAVLVTAGMAGATVVPALALFDAPAQFGLPASAKSPFPVAIAAGDVTSDGINDVVTANRGTGNISVLAGDGSGRFLPAVNYPTGRATSDVTVDDIDGDGTRDDAAATNRRFSTVTLFLNTDGEFEKVGELTDHLDGPSAVRVGDFDGDGIPDLAVASSRSNTVTLFLGQGGGRFDNVAHFAPTVVGMDPASRSRPVTSTKTGRSTWRPRTAAAPTCRSSQATAKATSPSKTCRSTPMTHTHRSRCSRRLWRPPT